MSTKYLADTEMVNRSENEDLTDKGQSDQAGQKSVPCLVIFSVLALVVSCVAIIVAIISSMAATKAASACASQGTSPSVTPVNPPAPQIAVSKELGKGK